MKISPEHLAVSIGLTYNRIVGEALTKKNIMPNLDEMTIITNALSKARLESYIVVAKKEKNEKMVIFLEKALKFINQ